MTSKKFYFRDFERRRNFTPPAPESVDAIAMSNQGDSQSNAASG